MVAYQNRNVVNRYYNQKVNSVKKFLYTNSSRPTCLKTTLSRILKNPFKISCILGTKLTDTARTTSYRSDPSASGQAGRPIGICPHYKTARDGDFVLHQRIIAFCGKLALI